MFFNNPQADNRQLPESMENLRTNLQTGVQDWFSGTPAGNSVGNWQNTAQQYGQNLNDWFNQTSLGQNVNQINSVYDQRMQQLAGDEQAREAEKRATMYDSLLKQLGL